MIAFFWVVFPLMALGGLWMFRNPRAVSDWFAAWEPPKPEEDPTFVAKPSLLDWNRWDQEIRTSSGRFLGASLMILGLGGLLMLVARALDR